MTDPPAASPLAGRSALVTGASRGIGLAIARALVSAGARVAMLARSADALEREAAALGRGAIAIPCDLTSESQLGAALDHLPQTAGDIDLFVSNAGVFPVARVEETPPAEFARALTLNVAAAFALLHALVPGMRTRGFGDVVTIGSIADRQIFPENGAYAATKFGVIGMMKTWARELGRKGIRANAICPGFIETPILSSIPDKVIKMMEDKVPMGRLGKPEEIANTYAWLASDEASYINGAVIEVSGGATI